VDPSATPWRVLEDPVDAAAAPAAEAGPGAASSRRVSRTALLTGAVALALIVGAFVVAFGTGPSGTVAVEGGLPVATATSSGDPGVGAAMASGRVLVVEIVGAVDRPGVFRLPAGSRVGDLVAAAGGYGARVDAGRATRELNLAAPLHDGDQVRVPSRDDVGAPTSRPGGVATGSAGPSRTGPIDLNRATAGDLDSLPGIGPVTAAKIIASREEQPFRAVADLRTRKLVGEKTFAQLKDLVTVS
jgi:competence protein ComEA